MAKWNDSEKQEAARATAQKFDDRVVVWMHNLPQSARDGLRALIAENELRTFDVIAAKIKDMP
jgi:hypothetical protein